MGFEVSLIFQIDTVLVSEIVPVRSIRIVGIAHMVDISALHHHNLFFHPVTAYCMTDGRTGFMAVNTFEFNRHSVYIEISSCNTELILFGGCIFKLNFTESDISGNGFKHLAFLVYELTNESVTPGRFSTPFLRVIESKGCFHLSLAAFCHIYRC